MSAWLELIPESQVRLGALAGQGSYGQVYRAVWKGMPVAVKCLLPDSAEVGEAPARSFEREMRALAALQHPNIVQVHGVMRFADGRVGLVEELAEEGSLWTLLGGDTGPRPLLTQRIFQLSLDIARALAYSHSQGLAHNDVKARNVLLCAGGAAKLCDFGLAKSVRTAFPSTFSRLSSTRTRLSSTAGSEDGLLGSLEWTAPENYTPGPHWGQPPADIYSFGCLLYEMASGRAPWQGRNSGDVLSAVRRGERPTLPGGVDGGLAALMARCWTAAPERRPTAAALVAELTALVQPATAFTPQLVVRSPGAAAPGEYRPSAFPSFTVFVKTLTRTLELQLPAKGQTTTAGLKALVERELGTPSAQQRLIFGGSELEEGHTLSEYSIQNASILHLAAGRGRVPSAADAPQEQLLARLVAMGFSRELALQGLESTGGLLTERTLDFLLLQQQQTRAGTAARGGGGGAPAPAPAPAAATPAAARQPTEACCVLA